ncbi:MAG: hypothetical protein Ta2F_03000 [Termitinemataceae bacterium]|nr:MAG: hypothetical protein Ta2F_03000 [Termitinemataceae bacterium]
MRKKKNLMGIIGAVLIIGGILTGCDTGNTNPEDTNPSNTIPSITEEKIVFTTVDSSGDTVELTIIKAASGQSANINFGIAAAAKMSLLVLPQGSTYVLRLNGQEVSRGTVVIAEDGLTATFTSVTGKTFTAEIEDDAVANISPITTESGDTLDVPDMGSLNDSFTKSHQFVKKSESELAVNIFGRGDGVAFLPTDPRCDSFVLQSEGAGIFPIGTWIGGENNTEKIIFTATTITVDAQYFDTYRCNYQINDNTFILTHYVVVPYIPTAEQQNEIDNFNKTEFLSSHTWIPSTSTMKPRYKKPGIDYHIVDHPNMTFVNDADVIGTWTSVDFVNSIENFVPGQKQYGYNLFFKNLAFNAGGNATLKYDSSYAYDSKWTKGILKDGDVAPKYEIQTLSGTKYLFVEWKSGDYSVRAQKPKYYVFAKD